MEKMLPELSSSDFRIEKILKNKIRVRVVTIGTKYGIWPRSNRKYKCLEGKKLFIGSKDYKKLHKGYVWPDNDKTYRYISTSKPKPKMNFTGGKNTESEPERTKQTNLPKVTVQSEQIQNKVESSSRRIEKVARKKTQKRMRKEKLDQNRRAEKKLKSKARKQSRSFKNQRFCAC